MEATMATVVIGIAFYTLIIVLGHMMWRNIDLEVAEKKLTLAKGKMEELTAQDFAFVASVSLTSFPGDFSAYSYEAIVNYVDAADLDTSVDPTVTDFKRVEVRVSYSLSGGTLDLISLVADE